jgi:nitric oxide reductase NorD protein
LSLDEFLFKSISNYKRRSKERKLKQQTTVVWLDQIKPRLILVARALTGSEIEIFTAEREGGYKNHNFFFPEYCNLFPEKVKKRTILFVSDFVFSHSMAIEAKLAT